MDKTQRTQGSRLTALLSCCALALVLTAAPGFGPFAGDGWDGAAHAKSENGGGNKGDKGNSGDKGNKGKSATAKGKSAKSASTDGTLTPSQKGKWNAMNASTQALAAHIANGNFNGTIGALAQLHLAAKAASGADLTDEELAALAGFVDSEIEITDDQIVEALNGAVTEGADAAWSVTDGVISCTGADCPDEVGSPGATAAAIEAAQTTLEEEALQEAYDQLLEDSKTRIVEESNKPLDDTQQEQLFDEIGEIWELDLTPEAPAATTTTPTEGTETPPVEEEV